MDPLSFLASKILPIFIDIIQHVDKEAWSHLKQHSNKIICFDILHFSPLYFQITENGLNHIQPQQQPIDTTFAGPLSAFLGMVFSKNHNHGLHIKGDIDCAKALYDTWHMMDIDFEGQVAKVLGKNLAHVVCQGFSQTQKNLKDAIAGRQEDWGAYLQDEIKILPSQIEVEDFFTHIDTLRHDVDRLEARLHHLQRHLRG